MQARIGQAEAALGRQRSRAAAAGREVALREAARLACAFVTVASGAAAASAACSEAADEADRRIVAIASTGRGLIDCARGDASARLDAATLAAMARLGAGDDGAALAATVRARGLAGVDRCSARVDALLEGCARGVALLAERCDGSLATAAALLDALDPLAVMKRGYALVLDGAGGSVMDRSKARTTGALTIRFRDGDLGVVVGGDGPDGSGK